MLKSRQSILNHHEKKLIANINPSKVYYRAKGKYPVMNVLRKISSVLALENLPFQKLEPFQIPKLFYGKPKKIESLPKFKKVEDIILNQHQFRISIWYNKLLNQQKNNGTATYKNKTFSKISEIDNFFESTVIPLIDSLDSEGFSMHKGGGIACVYVGANGNLEKSNAAEHRFYMCKILNVKSFPVKINGVHSDWIKSQKISSEIQLFDAISEVIYNHQ